MTRWRSKDSANETQERLVREQEGSRQRNERGLVQGGRGLSREAEETKDIRSS